jgi:hypothetical protein
LFVAILSTKHKLASATSHTDKGQLCADVIVREREGVRVRGNRGSQS